MAPQLQERVTDKLLVNPIRDAFTAGDNPLIYIPKLKIAVVDANKEECRQFCELLAQRHYETLALFSLADLENRLKDSACNVVLMDIDSIPVDNRTLRDLTIRLPDVYFLCTSKDRFHPELKDAICYHIYACLNKPLDPDELFYWLKSIDEEDTSS